MKAINLSTASVALAALLFADAAEAAVQAGVAAAVRGDVDLTPVVEQVVRPIDSGEDVFLGDALKSHEQSGMQLLLLDETSITMGPNADLTVDEFVYDPATGAGEVAASLAEGVFRFVTGKTARGDPQAMTLKVPFGVIGVRGTIGAVRNDAARSLVVLLGPGLNNNANERSGALDVTAQGRTVSLIRPRFGTIMEAGQPHGIVPAGMLALDIARVEAGLILIDVDYVPARHAIIEDRKSSPFELGLGWAVKLDKPAFVGRDALLAEKERGPEWEFKGLEISWESMEALYGAVGLPPQIPSEGWRASVPVYDGRRQVGYATSGCWSPILKKYIALAHLQTPHSETGTQLTMEVTVEHHRRRASARVVQHQFFNPERKRS